MPKEDVKDPLDYLPSNTGQGTAFFCNTDFAEIIDIVKNLETKKSCGYDTITNRVVKETSYIIAPYLEKLFNICLSDGVFPDCFKIAKVTPLFKGGSKQDPNSYRPIALLPCIGKVFERIISTRLLSFLEKYDILSEHQFGFRKHYSTNHALVSIVEHIKQNLDNNKFTCGVFVDLEKAFNTVNHEILIKNLNTTE